MLRVKKKDIVMVLAGKDKGKRGEIRKVLKNKDQVLVAGMNIVTKHSKPAQNKLGGIEKIESPLDISNVALICPKCDKATRVSIKKLDDGDKIRFCKKCGKEII